jgi:Family of unknown function (DUF6152)
MKRSWLMAVIGALGISGGALAHHGWSGYESGKPLTLTGIIRESAYENPHGHVTLEVEGRKWHVVLAPPSRMERRGLTREELAVGVKASVEGYPHRTTRDELRAERITVSGETVELR